MSVGHYENFPVASLILPARLRRPVESIYRFARSADDFADEGVVDSGVRLARLEEYRDELRRLQRKQTPQSPLFRALGEAIMAYGLPMRPFFDLLDAFSQDVVKFRYANFAELMDYCRRSADPVGRLMLQLVGEASEENLPLSDSICSALQITNFLQDVEVDFLRGRVYLPQDEIARYDLTDAQIGAASTRGMWSEMMRFQAERARSMLQFGAPLAVRIPGRMGIELRVIVQGGLRILEKIDAVRGDVFRHRPVLSRPDWLLMFYRALRM